MPESSAKRGKKRRGRPKGAKTRSVRSPVTATSIPAPTSPASATAATPSQPVRRVVYVSSNSITNIRPKHPLPSHLFLLPQYQRWPLIAAAMQPSTSAHSSEEIAEVKADDTALPGVVDESLVPKIDMLFDSEEDAYHFYNTYADKVGFFIRRSTLWTSCRNIVTRRTFVCSREGFLKKRNDGPETKNPRPQTRIGCPASMTVRLMPNGKYRVAEFDPNHNHPLATALMMNILKSKKLRRNSRVEKANMIDKTVKVPDFENEDEAYDFYSIYAGRLGFSIRRASVQSNADNVVTRRQFVCSREGFRDDKRGLKKAKNRRPETRTGCPAGMVIKRNPDGKYRVSEFITCHNHPLLGPSSPADLLMPFDIDSSEDCNSDEADELQVNSGLKRPGEKESELLVSPGNIYFNRNKRKRFGQMGDAGAMLEYLQKRQNDESSFFYTVMAHGDGRMTNFFWADAKSISDFTHFGDMVCLDAIYKAYGDGKRPLSLFIGLNHHKKIVIFGAALMYDESRESFKWLFDSFKLAMNGVQPKTVFTEKSAAISDAVAASLPAVAHRFCVWQIYQKSLEQLNQAFHGSKTLESDFKRCLFDLDDKDEFLSYCQEMLEKYDLKDNKWLSDLFSQKEKWSLAYGRENFYGDLKSVQLKENYSLDIKKYLSPEEGLSSFFEHYEKLLEVHRLAEAQADHEASQTAKKIPCMRMLKQAANVYTPAAYKMFEKEFELYMDCLLFESNTPGPICEYKITVEGSPKAHFVKFNSLDGIISCSCRMYEFMGIPCRHVLKVFDVKNIKDLPSQYILKRWRKDARAIPATNLLDVDLQTSEAKRFKYLCRMFSILASRSAVSAESAAYAESQSVLLLEQVEQLLQARPDIAILIANPSEGPMTTFPFPSSSVTLGHH